MAYYIVEAPYYYPEHPMTDPDRCRLMDGAKLLVRCKDCKHRPKRLKDHIFSGFDLKFPKESKCPCGCEDGFYSWYPEDDWYCANGELKETEGKDGD